MTASELPVVAFEYVRGRDVVREIDKRETAQRDRKQRLVHDSCSHVRKPPKVA